jgi:hypothetical protein
MPAPSASASTMPFADLKVPAGHSYPFAVGHLSKIGRRVLLRS